MFKKGDKVRHKRDMKRLFVVTWVNDSYKSCGIQEIDGVIELKYVDYSYLTLEDSDEVSDDIKYAASEIIKQSLVDYALLTKNKEMFMELTSK